MNVPAVGATPSRELAAHVLYGFPFAADDALAKFDSRDIQPTRQLVCERLVPLKHLEPKLDGTNAKVVRDGLRACGVKVRPDFSESQAAPWLNATLRALSDLPVGCLKVAVIDAIHTPFAFPNEVEAKVRELAEKERKHHQQALYRLDAMQAQLHRAANPQPQLVDDTPRPITDSEVHEWQRKGLTSVIRLGLANGHIKPHQLLPPDDPSIPTNQGASE